MNAYDYFEERGIEYFKAKGIIGNARGHNNILHSQSVEALEKDLIEQNISQIEDPNGWFFTNSGDFHNKSSKEFRSGNWRKLKNPGAVFQGQNRHINPFYKANDKVDEAFRKAQLEKATKLIQEGLSILQSL
ncbi:hypothetical protein [Desulfoluna sp.]|uniref:hypothetical protein n=1 Tax=Desulfoluna sp. TaxID=2045199 RepID=UPI00260F4675|nr:hypothetical protein [Desulfoluna sp.]